MGRKKNVYERPTMECCDYKDKDIITLSPSIDPEDGFGPIM